MANFIKAPKDFFAGLLLMGIAAAFAAGLPTLSIGTAFRMGPGYFPMLLTIALAVLAAILIVRGVLRPGEAAGTFPWRGVLLITGPVVFFAATLNGFGLVPSLSATILATTFAARAWDAKVAISLTIVQVLFCVLVFVYGLGLPLPLFGPWLVGH